MEPYAHNWRQFERAATLRDVRMALDSLQDHLARLRRVQGCDAFVYPLAGRRGRRTWYLMRAGQVVEAVAEPRDRAAALRCLDVLERVYGGMASGAPDDFDVSLLMAAWFRYRSRELANTVAPEAAVDRCRQML